MAAVIFTKIMEHRQLTKKMHPTFIPLRSIKAGDFNVRTIKNGYRNY
jgi:hypothetical protein